MSANGWRGQCYILALSLVEIVWADILEWCCCKGGYVAICAQTVIVTIACGVVTADMPTGRTEDENKVTWIVCEHRDCPCPCRSRDYVRWVQSLRNTEPRQFFLHTHHTLWLRQRCQEFNHVRWDLFSPGHQSLNPFELGISLLRGSGKPLVSFLRQFDTGFPAITCRTWRKWKKKSTVGCKDVKQYSQIQNLSKQAEIVPLRKDPAYRKAWANFVFSPFEVEKSIR